MLAGLAGFDASATQARASEGEDGSEGGKGLASTPAPRRAAIGEQPASAPSRARDCLVASAPRSRETDRYFGIFGARGLFPVPFFYGFCILFFHTTRSKIIRDQICHRTAYPHRSSTFSWPRRHTDTHAQKKREKETKSSTSGKAVKAAKNEHHRHLPVCLKNGIIALTEMVRHLCVGR